VAPTTLATYALVAAAVPFLIGLPMDAMLLRLVFITLAALTVPHMILELIASPRRQA
jgi:type IV secretory pathway VirB3-like protein